MNHSFVACWPKFTFCLTAQPGITLAKYALKSANDIPGRDPAEWNLFGVASTGERKLLHSFKEKNAWKGKRWSWREFQVENLEDCFTTIRLEISGNNGQGCTQLGQVHFFDRHEGLVASTPGGSFKLLLKSHPGFGIGRMYKEERRAGPWRYTESALVPAKHAVTVNYEDGKFVKLKDADLVFDVSYWKMECGNTVNFVGGATKKEKTKQSGGGRDWVLNSDGTIGAMHRPDLVLGIALPDCTLVEKDAAERFILDDEAAKVMKEPGVVIA